MNEQLRVLSFHGSNYRLFKGFERPATGHEIIVPFGNDDQWGELTDGLHRTALVDPTSWPVNVLEPKRHVANPFGKAVERKTRTAPGVIFDGL